MNSRKVLHYLLGRLRIDFTVRLTQNGKGLKASSKRSPVMCQVAQMGTERNPHPTPTHLDVRLTCWQLVLNTTREGPLGSHRIHSLLIFLILGDMGSQGPKGKFYCEY